MGGLLLVFLLWRLLPFYTHFASSGRGRQENQPFPRRFVLSASVLPAKSSTLARSRIVDFLVPQPLSGQTNATTGFYSQHTGGKGCLLSDDYFRGGKEGPSQREGLSTYPPRMRRSFWSTGQRPPLPPQTTTPRTTHTPPYFSGAKASGGVGLAWKGAWIDYFSSPPLFGTTSSVFFSFSSTPGGGY